MLNKTNEIGEIETWALFVSKNKSLILKLFENNNIESGDKRQHVVIYLTLFM